MPEAIRPAPSSATEPIRQPVARWTRITALSLALIASPTAAAFAQTPTTAEREQVVDLTFPVADPDDGVTFIDDYDQARSGDRTHAATDVMAPKHRPVHAAVGGTITWAPDPEPSYGWMISIAGDDGFRYAYVHLNNDTPKKDADGSWLDDDQGGIEHAYAPRIVEAIRDGGASGLRIERGELIGWVGNSGNAKYTAPHLHFEIHGTNEDGEYRVNPYESLKAALAEGDVPGTATSTGTGDEDFEGTFRDVDPAGSHADAIEELTAAAIAFGCESDRYCPDTAITRGEVAAYLAAAFSLTTSATSTPFEDVDSTHPHVGAIAATDTAGILRGYEEDRFGPDEALSREQLASVLVRAFEVPDASAPAPFTDVTTGWTHADAIAAAAEAGLTVGCGDGSRFCRTDSVTRGQMASFLSRALAEG